MVLEISPKSVFGRHNYPREQILIAEFVRDVDKAVLFINPLAVGGYPIPFNRLPLDFRRKKVHEHLESARKKLDELGV